MSDAFAATAQRILEDHLARHPVSATFLGDHRHDAELGDPSAAADDERERQIAAHLAALEQIDGLDPADDIDRAVLSTVLRSEHHSLGVTGDRSWNPMLHNPGSGLHSLLSRDVVPLEQRLRAVAGRLERTPGYLAAARGRLGPMSKVHVETAIGQFGGTLALVDEAVAAAQGTSEEASVTRAADAARDALTEHRAWLAEQLDEATHDPRLGAEPYAAKLALTLDTDMDPAALLAAAERDLALVTERITEHAGRIAGEARPTGTTVRAVLDRLAGDAPTNETILGLCRGMVSTTTDFVRELDLVTVHDDEIRVIEMPEIDRGVAVAYCRPPGPLEAAPPPTEYAVSPTPDGWTPEQVASFYREYNRHMLHELTVHEAVPGHALQLAHANRYAGRTPVRRVWWSGSFVEGWAVYAEELMAERGYRRDESPDAHAALVMQQLKMQLRMLINTIMDVRFHVGDLDEAAAMDLMTSRGFQEQGEALGKWRRVQLTATQLSTYYVGYREVRDLVADLRAARPDDGDRAIHDAVLGYGSPPARHLRTLLGV